MTTRIGAPLRGVLLWCAKGRGVGLLSEEGTPLECAGSDGYAEVTAPVAHDYAVIASED